jgi:hypothetical protein
MVEANNISYPLGHALPGLRPIRDELVPALCRINTEEAR